MENIQGTAYLEINWNISFTYKNFDFSLFKTRAGEGGLEIFVGYG